MIMESSRIFNPAFHVTYLEILPVLETLMNIVRFDKQLWQSSDSGEMKCIRFHSIKMKMQVNR